MVLITDHVCDLYNLISARGCLTDYITYGLSDMYLVIRERWSHQAGPAKFGSYACSNKTSDHFLVENYDFLGFLLKSGRALYSKSTFFI